jgi:hypothetical protein
MPPNASPAAKVSPQWRELSWSSTSNTATRANTSVMFPNRRTCISAPTVQSQSCKWCRCGTGARLEGSAGPASWMAFSTSQSHLAPTAIIPSPTWRSPCTAASLICMMDRYPPHPPPSLPLTHPDSHTLPPLSLPLSSTSHPSVLRQLQPRRQRKRLQKLRLLVRAKM